MDEPLIDILMGTYNGERFVGEQIESIQAQTYQNWQLLVSDDCSTDGTLGVVRRYAAKDNRIKIVSDGERFGGAKENFFSLMHKSAAPYAMFCDQDDVWLPEKIEKSFAALRALEDKYGTDAPLLVFCDMKVVDSGLAVIHESFEGFTNLNPRRLAFRQLLVQNVAAGCSMLFNHAVLDICLWATGEGAEMHDWWAMLIASAFGRISFIAESLTLYRQHGRNEVGAREYAPIESAKNLDRAVKLYIESSMQARAFESVYCARLGKSQQLSLQRYIRAGRAAIPLQRVYWLVRSGCWKRGTSKAGQMVAAIRTQAFEERGGR